MFDAINLVLLVDSFNNPALLKRAACQTHAHWNQPGISIAVGYIPSNMQLSRHKYSLLYKSEC